MADILGIWVAVFLTLAIYSFTYKENPWFRVAEAVYLGSATGYVITTDLKYIRDQWTGVWSLTGPMMLGFSLAMLFGLLWYFRFSRKYFYIYRIPLAIIVGTGIGQAMQTIIFAQFISQIRGQISMTLYVANDALKTFSNIMIAIMVPCVLLYFWFTGGYKENVGMKVIDKIARYTMMAGFGSAFGYTVLTRYALFIGRVQYLLGLTPNPPETFPAFVVIATIILITLIGWDVFKRKTKA